MESGFVRKYAIMEELDSGFSSGSVPEAFVRLDSWEGRIQASIHVKGLKQGPFAYKLYLIFERNKELIPLLAGTMSTAYSGMQSGLAIDAKTLKTYGIKPESVRFAAITAENKDTMWIPLFSSFEKGLKWDETIRQVLLKKPEKKSQKPETIEASGHKNDVTPAGPEDKGEKTQESGTSPDIETKLEPDTASVTGKDIAMQNSDHGTKSGNDFNDTQDKRNSQYNIRLNENNNNKCDIHKLESLLKNNFEGYEPFPRSSRGYSWYRASDLAKLSNIMYMAGINVPLFANPKILVGLFKFKHILAGLYRGDNGFDYYVIGVPAKDEHDNKPFDNACRWVPVNEAPVRDMGGYWLVYISMKSGEIVV
jgi:hypothetical protein